MPKIRLPDGAVKSFDGPVTVAEVAQAIGPGLARAALAGRVNGKLVDTSFRLENDCELAIVTERDKEGVEILRHSTAHLLAYAVKDLFPEAQVTIGPVIENGFYYDFSFKRPFTPEDLEAIEKRMAELAKKNFPVRREVWPRDKAVQYFKSIGERYKAEIVASIPSNEEVSLYREGDFIDLCRGPHVPSTGKLRVFKLTKVAGAYWRGDSKNEMLQRIYGTAWAKKEEQDAYLRMIEEADKRDHRRLGTQLDLFHLQEEAPGMVFWHPKGWSLWQEVEQYMRRDYAIKPMNCPGHVLIYNKGLRSYRELPLRYGEFGVCTRNEPSGALHGIMRIRAFTQDDGHIFCTEEQIQPEVTAHTTLLQKVYADLGFTDVVYKLATRPPKRVGADELWDKAERALQASLESSGLAFEMLAGEGAFYGPKIEYHLKDSIGRSWQCGTMQVDFSMPGLLGAQYVAEDNARRVPVMLHRAIVGSMERFIGILIEHYAGAMPLWLAPVQVVVLNISEGQTDYAKRVEAALKQAGYRCEADLRNEKITYKIREHSLQKLPYQLIVGEKEKAAEKVAVRTRSGEDLGQMFLPDFVARLRSEAKAGSTA
ncbi:MAG: threonine--tRNA ligase [Betaproteobacteria bacterium]|nr:MAG: threonine--tRNA ligase [Betaproteobacteria bacterium]